MISLLKKKKSTFHRFETKDVNFAHIHKRKIYTDIYLKLFRNFLPRQMKTMNFPQFNYLTEKNRYIHIEKNICEFKLFQNITTHLYLRKNHIIMKYEKYSQITKFNILFSEFPQFPELHSFMFLFHVCTYLRQSCRQYQGPNGHPH